MASFIGAQISATILCKSINNNIHNTNNMNTTSTSLSFDAGFIRRAAELADKSAGFTSPHPNFGCIIATPSGTVAGEGFLYAQGTKPAEVLALEAAGDFACGSTVYLNMEPGDCHGEHAAVSALIQVSLCFNFFNCFRL